MQLTKTDIVFWINRSLPNNNLQKIEQLGNGQIYCQLMNLFCPNLIPVAKINMKAKSQVDNILNFKQLQQSLIKIGIKKNIDIDKLSKHSFQENFELSIFLINYFESNKEKLQNLKLNDKVSPMNVFKKNKENTSSCIQAINQQQMNEFEQLQNQKNQLRQILLNRDVDNIDKLKQIDQLFVFALSPYKNQPEAQNLNGELTNQKLNQKSIVYSTYKQQNSQSEKLFLSQPRERSQVDNSNQGLIEELDLVNFDNLPNQISQGYSETDYKSLYLDSRQFYSANDHQNQQSVLDRLSGHFQLTAQEEPLLMSKAVSQCKSNQNYTFSKEEQNQTPQQQSVIKAPLASSSKKILNLQNESNYKNLGPQPQIFNNSPQFSQPQMRYPKICQNQVEIQVEDPSCLYQNQQFSMDINAFSSSYREVDFSNKDTRREAQSLPISKSKYYQDNQDGNFSVGKVHAQALICIEKSGGGRIIEE